MFKGLGIILIIVGIVRIIKTINLRSASNKYVEREEDSAEERMYNYTKKRDMRNAARGGIWKGIYLIITALLFFLIGYISGI